MRFIAEIIIRILNLGVDSWLTTKVCVISACTSMINQLSGIKIRPDLYVMSPLQWKWEYNLPYLKIQCFEIQHFYFLSHSIMTSLRNIEESERHEDIAYKGTTATVESL